MAEPTADDYIEHLSVMLVGRKGHGRTSLARALLAQSDSPDQTECCVLHGDIKSSANDTWKLTLIDTPGIGDLDFTKEHIVETIRRQREGVQQVDTFLYVLRYNLRVRSTEIEAIDLLEDKFFGTFLKRAIFVFIHDGRTALNSEQKQNFVDSLPKTFKEKAELAGNRVCLVGTAEPNSILCFLEELRGMVREIMREQEKPCILKEEASLWDIYQYISVLEYFTNGQSGNEGNDFDDFFVVDFEDVDSKVGTWVKVVVSNQK
ncbi:uncharacterized protein LOC106160579 [Lingula anatina]|uniref:Uncharacterized protein LOC106160579 n=1 Tax=Lingula anatina TaxID=7574 RepID=A0A1S3I362_LINAN|nr:uncharacterized protein LOC106160579 [Lingula anatina]|eukprot:XP_013392673.1 uncharacterized protein LOC106160579 [Lingula anatina]